MTDADGRRRQHSKGGFKTQKQAEDARIAAMNAKATGTYVKAEKISVRDFLVDEWLPSRLPPALESSTWHSYEQKIRLQVIPHIGNIPLQQLSPVDLNKLYRHLLDAGRRPPNPKRRRSPEVYERAVALRAESLTYEQTAETLRAKFESESKLNKHSVAALIRRGPPATIDPDSVSGLSPRTVRYVHTILRAALKDALGGIAPCGTSLMLPRPRQHLRRSRPVRRCGPPTNSERSSITPPTVDTYRRGSSSPRQAADAAKASGSSGPMSTSTLAPP